MNLGDRGVLNLIFFGFLVARTVLLFRVRCDDVISDKIMRYVTVGSALSIRALLSASNATHKFIPSLQLQMNPE